MPNFRNLSAKLYTLNPNQEGFSMVIWVFLVVFIFSVLVVTGSFSLDGTKSTYSAIPSDTPTVSGAPKPSTSPAKTTDWSINAVLSECKNAREPYMQGTVTAKGSDAGYVELDIDDGGEKVIVSAGFTPTTSTYNLTLDNSRGFNNHTWKLKLFSGGSKPTSGEWSGGTLKATKDGASTGC